MLAAPQLSIGADGAASIEDDLPKAYSSSPTIPGPEQLSPAPGNGEASVRGS